MSSIRGSRRRGVSAIDGEVTRPRSTLHEAAHKSDVLVADNAEPQTATKVRSFNEAAHKLEEWPPFHEEPQVQAEPSFAREENRDVVASAGRLVLALGALGVVYGDIGKSPLHTEQVIFTNDRAASASTRPELRKSPRARYDRCAAPRRPYRRWQRTER
jgi:hypothetical protein